MSVKPQKQTARTIADSTLDKLATFALEVSQKYLNINDPFTTYSFNEVLSDIDDRAADYGFERVGYGSTRVVYKFPESDRVVKLPVNTSLSTGTEQNRTEAYISEHISGDSEHRLFTVLEVADDNKWLIAPYAPETFGDNEFEEEVAQNNILDDFPYLSSHNNELLHAENIGWNPMAKTYGVLDYGSHIPREFVERELGPEHIEAIGEENLA